MRNKWRIKLKWLIRIPAWKPVWLIPIETFIISFNIIEIPSKIWNIKRWGRRGGQGRGERKYSVMLRLERNSRREVRRCFWLMTRTGGWSFTSRSEHWAPQTMSLCLRKQDYRLGQTQDSLLCWMWQQRAWTIQSTWYSTQMGGRQGCVLLSSSPAVQDNWVTQPSPA